MFIVFALKEGALISDLGVEHLLWLAILLLVLAVVALTVLFYRLLRTDKKLRQENRELERSQKALMRTTDELIKAERFAVLGMMYSSLAHELNTPLGVIINSAGRLLRRKEELNEDLVFNLTQIQKGAKKTQVTVQRFLSSSRKKISEGHSNLYTVYEEWYELFGEEITAHGVKLDIQIAEECEIAIDSASTFQIYNNIFSNAAHAVHSSEGEKRIIVTTGFREHYIEMTVQDTGPGFHPDILDQSFSPFRSTKEAGKGTGIGLWLVYSMMSEYGGQLEVGNTLLGGIVHLYFPRYKPGE